MLFIVSCRMNSLTRNIEILGRKTVSSIEEFGYISALFFESIYWLVVGKRRNQSIRFSAIINEARKIGVDAVGISAVLCFAIGIMLAIQGIETLKTFGAQSQVILGIALSVTREFSPLIIGILVAGRSGSSIAARIGTMNESQEIDALQVMGINPVRYLASPILIAMLVMLPLLVILGDFMGLLGGALYAYIDLNISFAAYAERSFEILSVNDLSQGLIKSFVFAVIIALVSLSNGFQVSGGAEGVGTATTRSVVMSISFIVLADMLFTYFLNR